MVVPVMVLVVNSASNRLLTEAFSTQRSGYRIHELLLRPHGQAASAGGATAVGEGQGDLDSILVCEVELCTVSNVLAEERGIFWNFNAPEVQPLCTGRGKGGILFEEPQLELLCCLILVDGHGRLIAAVEGHSDRDGSSELARSSYLAHCVAERWLWHRLCRVAALARDDLGSPPDLVHHAAAA